MNSSISDAVRSSSPSNISHTGDAMLDEFNDFKAAYYGDITKRLFHASRLQTTANWYVHEFCVEHVYQLQPLARNRRISPEVAVGILEHLENGRYYADSLLARENTLLYLLGNKVIHYNLPLLQRTLNNPEMNASRIPSIFSVRAATLRGSLEGRLPVENFLYLTEFLASTPYASNRNPFREAFYERNEEIREFLRTTQPELAEMPLSWIMHVYGLEA